MRLYLQSEAAKRLGYSKPMMHALAENGKLVPAVVLMPAEEYLYSEDQIVKYKLYWQNPRGMTIHEIVKKYGATYTEVFGALRIRYKVDPVGYRRTQMVFSPEEVEAVAFKEMWIVQPSGDETPVLAASLQLGSEGLSLRS